MRRNLPMLLLTTFALALAASHAAAQTAGAPAGATQAANQAVQAPGAPKPVTPPPVQVPPPKATPAAGELKIPQGVSLPAGYTIGTEDVLSVVFRYDKDMTSDVTVRPDGMISLPILNDVRAAGLTPDELREAVNEAAKKYIEGDPAVTVIVKQINSRKVFVTGEVNRPGAYALTSEMTVLQLIAMAGGLTDYAKAKDIVVMRQPSGKSPAQAFAFNYKQVVARKNLSQNIALKPGDTVIVP
jgi:polysaccharide biosynthesis/export protein